MISGFFDRKLRSQFDDIFAPKKKDASDDKIATSEYPFGSPLRVPATHENRHKSAVGPQDTTGRVRQSG